MRSATIREALQKLYPGKMPDFGTSAFIEPLSQILYDEWMAERIERMMRHKERLNPSVYTMTTRLNALKAEGVKVLEKSAAKEKKLFMEKQALEAMSRTGEEDMSVFVEKKNLVEFLETQVRNQPEQMAIAEKLRNALVEIDRTISPLRIYQSAEEVSCGALQFGGWAANSISYKSGTPPQQLRMLLSLCDHALSQLGCLAAGTLPHGRVTDTKMTTVIATFRVKENHGE